MILELTHEERIALHTAVDDSIAEFLRAFPPDVAARTPEFAERMAVLKDLKCRLAFNESADIGTPPDLRAGASL